MACLDTTALVDLAGGCGRQNREGVRRKLASLQSAGDILVTTRLNVAELHVGVHRSRDRAAELARVRAVLRPLGVLDFDQRAAEAFGRIVAALLRAGRPIGDRDALIGAVCLVAGHRMVTRNTAHFARIPGLVVESY